MGEHRVPRMDEHGVLRMGEHGVTRMDEHGVLRVGTEYLEERFRRAKEGIARSTSVKLTAV